MLLSVHIKREGESPVVSPLSSEDIHHSDRYQVKLMDTHTHTQHCERLVLTEQPVGRRADEMQPWMKKKGKKEQQKAPGCALVRGAPREKDEAVEGSYSRLRTPAQEQVTHMADA